MFLADAAECGYCRDLLTSPHEPKRLWMGIDKMLFESLDEGQTWSWQNWGLPNVQITCIYLSHDWRKILVATFVHELFTVPTTAVNVVLVASALWRMFGGSGNSLV